MRRFIATMLAVGSLILGSVVVGTAPANAAPVAPCKQYIYRQGGDGNCVKALQTLVSTKAYPGSSVTYIGSPIARDGKFGPATRAAIVKFQKKTGLAADGVVGRRTWAKLCTGSYAGTPALKREWNWAYNYACD